MSDFISIPVTDEHRKMLERSKDKLASFYKLEGNIELLEVAAKVIPDSGTYYKFTVIDENKKTAILKVDELHSRSKWDAAQWAEQ